MVDHALYSTGAHQQPFRLMVIQALVYPAIQRAPGIDTDTHRTCNVEHWLESKPKSSYFENVLFLAALVDLGQCKPVLLLEHSVIPSIESWSLVLLKVIKHDIISRMMPPVEQESNFCCLSIISILNQLLIMKETNAWVCHIYKHLARSMHGIHWHWCTLVPKAWSQLMQASAKLLL